MKYKKKIEKMMFEETDRFSGTIENVNISPYALTAKEIEDRMQIAIFNIILKCETKCF